MATTESSRRLALPYTPVDPLLERSERFLDLADALAVEVGVDLGPASARLAAVGLFLETGALGAHEPGTVPARARALARICMWRGDPDLLLAALLDAHGRPGGAWLERTSDPERLYLVGWERWGGVVLERRKWEAKRKAEYRGKGKRVVSEMSHGTSTESDTVSHGTGQKNAPKIAMSHEDQDQDQEEDLLRSVCPPRVIANVMPEKTDGRTEGLEVQAGGWEWLLDTARAHVAGERWREARVCLGELLRAEPGHGEGRALLVRVDRALGISAPWRAGDLDPEGRARWLPPALGAAVRPVGEPGPEAAALEAGTVTKAPGAVYYPDEVAALGLPRWGPPGWTAAERLAALGPVPGAALARAIGATAGAEAEDPWSYLLACLGSPKPERGTPLQAVRLGA